MRTDYSKKAKFFWLIGASLVLAPMASAQQSSGQQKQPVTTEKRVEKLEKEMKAVQRKVFPGADGGFFEPEIQPEQKKPDAVGTSPALSDLTARVDALEAQLATLTNASEQYGQRLKMLETQFTAYKAEQAAKAKEAAEAVPAVSSAPTPAPAPVKPVAVKTDPAPAKPAAPKTTPAAKTPAIETASPISTSPKRLAAVKAVAIPNTGNAGEDAYMYGYNLWVAKLYPEAQAQLRKVVETYPKHRRASFAQNLLGRAYMDEGKPNLAITAFFRNFKDMPRGERAPDSLYFMGQTLISMGKNEDACTTFAELEKSYGSTLNATLRRDTDAAKRTAKCS
jgi:TolA-binding protein